MLNQDEPRGRLSFPGCHSIIYPVELPEWVPSHITDRLTKHFQVYLRRELDIMVQRDAANVQIKRGHASHESESNISVASTTGPEDDSGDEVEEYEEECEDKDAT
jgi:hypothetical protein